MITVPDNAYLVSIHAQWGYFHIDQVVWPLGKCLAELLGDTLHPGYIPVAITEDLEEADVLIDAMEESQFHRAVSTLDYRGAVG
jgi:hypothetical protein